MDLPILLVTAPLNCCIICDNVGATCGRPFSSAVISTKNMQVIWHDHIGIEGNGWVRIVPNFQLFQNNFTTGRQG